MIIVKTREEIELMRESALIVSKTLGMIAREIKPGVTTFYSRSWCSTKFSWFVWFSKFTLHESKCTSCSRNSK